MAADRACERRADPKFGWERADEFYTRRGQNLRNNHNAKFDLSLYLFESPEGLQGVLEYCTDLFEPATAARMAFSSLVA